MLDDYLNQTAQYIAAERNEDNSVKMNNRGEIQYLAPVSIPCRRRDQAKEIITTDKQIIQITRIYYLMDLVRVDDLLDGMRVQDVIDWVDLDGDILGFKAVV